MKTATIIFKLALRLPYWVYGRKAILDMCFMYVLINSAAQAQVTVKKENLKA